MKGEDDRRLERAQARKPRQGGKSLQRLFLFNGQRDPLLNEAVVVQARAPKAARPRWLLTPQARQLSTSRDAQTERAEVRGADLAADLIGAATALPPAIAAAPGTAVRLWRSIGPDRIPNGQTYGSNRVDVIGRVSAIAIDPSNARHVLCGAAGGGVWESRDEGATWAPRTDAMASLAIGAIAFDPDNPTVVYAGSGEGNFYARLGAGVFRSSDGGATWTAQGAGLLLGLGFYDLVVDPADGALLAATTGGFFVSMDQGANWTRRRAQPCWSISPHPVGGGSAEILVTFTDGLFQSTDRGVTFTGVVLPQAPTTSWSRLAVTRVRSQPDVAYVFGAAGANAFLWRRSATTWTRLLMRSQDGATNIDTGQAWYDWYVAAPPDRTDRVYLGAIDGQRGDLAGGKWSWQNFVTRGANSIHPDQHCLAFAPNNSQIIYAGNDGGIYRSSDGGSTWQSCNSGIAITEVEYMAVDPNDVDWLLAGTQDNGTLRLNQLGWDHVADGDGGDCGVNEANPNEVFHSYYGVSLDGSLKKGDTGSWTGLQPTPMPALFYPPICVAGRTIAIGGDAAILTRNAAAPWSKVTLSLGANDVCSAGFAPNANRVYFGTRAGRVLRLDWTQNAWTRTMLTSPFGAYVSCIASDPSDAHRLWATSSEAQSGGARVARSDDGGQTWVNCTAGLPPIPKNSVVIDPANSSRVWVAADVGVYETTDSGATWTAMSQGLPNAIAADLVFHASGRRLICGTRSRGVWVMDGL